MLRKTILLISTIFIFVVTACAPTAQNFYQKGLAEVKQYNCQSSDDFKTAAEMELKDEGKWYPIYMLSLGLSRYYCNDLDGAANAFGSIDQYTVLRSNRDAASKTFEFLKSQGNRTYELTEREETLLHYYMGMINFKKQNYEDAMVEFKKVDYIAEGVYSKLPLIALVRGMTYEKLNDPGNALVAYKKIVEQNPTSPVGYILCRRMEIATGNKVFWENELKSKFNYDLSKLDSGGKEIISLVEFSGGVSSDYKFEIIYNQLNNQAFLFDVVKPDFSFGNFAAGVLKEVGSKLAREAIKSIPIVGSFAGLFLGGDQAESRAWLALPEFYVVDVAYLNPGAYDLNVKLYDGSDLIKEKSTKMSTADNIVFITNF